MNKSIKKVNTKYLIAKRDELSKDITKYWNIIKTENVCNKAAMRNYDLKKLYELIQEMAAERTLCKLYTQCINMGMKSLTELPAENNYVTIYNLCEAKERLFHLTKIDTIDAKTKRRVGKKKLNETEVFTSSFIGKEIAKLKAEIVCLEKALDDFNAKAELDLTTTPKCLAA